MTFLVRMITNVDPWVDAQKKGTMAKAAAAPPLWALRDFIPSPKDDGKLSVYEVEGEEDAGKIAAAACVYKGEKEQGRVVFIAVDKAQVEGVGLAVIPSPSDWQHRYAQLQHREIPVQDFHLVSTLTALFLQGELFPFERKEVWRTIRNEVRRDQYLFSQIAKLNVQNPAAANLLKFVGEEIAIVRGVLPQPSPQQSSAAA